MNYLKNWNLMSFFPHVALPLLKTTSQILREYEHSPFCRDRFWEIVNVLYIKLVGRMKEDKYDFFPC